MMDNEGTKKFPNFLKAPLATIYTNFKGGARAKKGNFLVKTIQKTPFFGLFFQNFAHKFGPKHNQSLYRFGRARRINLVDLKKVDKFFEFFFENPPPRKNPRSAPPPPLRGHNFAQLGSAA